MTPMVATQEVSSTLAERMAKEHWERLYRSAYNVLKNPQDAEEATQDALLKALRYLSRQDQPPDWLKEVNERAPLPSEALYWMLAVVRNTCIDRYRRRRKKGEILGELFMESDLSAAPASVAERLDLHEALSRLPVDQEVAVVLHVFEGLTFKEMAEQLGEHQSTVSMRYYRALDQLRALLGEEAMP